MIGKIIEKGPRVVAYRAWQMGRLWGLRKIDYWPRLQRRIEAFWSGDRIARWREATQQGVFLISPDKLAAFQKWAAHQSEWRHGVERWATDLQQGRFSIFDQVYQLDWNHLPWQTDWRWAQTWPPAYYKTYHFYERDKEVPYDVKFPWELSRFSFLLPLAEMAVINYQPGWYEAIVKAVSDWEQTNPVAYSVNWNPMECSMRGLNLTLATQLLAADPRIPLTCFAPLLRQLTLHGEFLFRNIEFTDIRGNHYAANLVALLLLGTTLRTVYKPAYRWIRHAAQRICPEIELQFCEDGVNFEKSVAYHRLVTELFLLGLIVMRQAGYPVSQSAQERIHRACEYTGCYTRPDGLSPNWGDNDGARVLGFDPRPLRDHRSLLALAAAYFVDANCKAIAALPSATIPLLLGQAGLQTWASLPPDAPTSSSRFFSDGGVFISRMGQHYLFTDFGEVGNKGRGGHGHNDTFSFELSLAGQAVIVDSGSPVYTGDLNKYDRYRSTAAHNTAQIDGQEMASLLGTWRIANEAHPSQVQVQRNPQTVIIRGEHYGYRCLTDPVTHHRRLIFEPQAGYFRCVDSFQCQQRHQVERFLHFDPAIKGALSTESLSICLTSGIKVILRWSLETQARLEACQISDNYGQLSDSRRLVLENEIVGNNEVWFEVSWEQPA